MSKKISKFLLILTMLGFISGTAFASTGFLKREEVSGMNKICYYDVLGSIHTLNVAPYSLCPQTYNF